MNVEKSPGTRAKRENIEHFRNVGRKDPEEAIIARIQTLIAGGTLGPGMRLPSERVLSEQLGTSRGYVRKALQRLEFYGILEIKPQSGIFIADIGAPALEGLIASILNIHKGKARDLVETRSHLEILSARQAAARRSEEDLKAIRSCHEEYVRLFDEGASTLEADHLFHLAIVKASRNDVLRSLISLLTPDIIAMNKNFRELKGPSYNNTPAEHESIVQCIASGDSEGAGRAMELHMERSRVRRMIEDYEKEV
jgi:GntR family transcriptional regulator, transcriptional repressor for pyruvate dehydrogenase complex